MVNGILDQNEALNEVLSDMFVAHEKDVERATRVLKVLAHPARLRILCVLRTGEFSVQELEKHVGISQSTLSQHLSLLKDRGVVTSHRDGNHSIYSIAEKRLIQLFDLVREIYCQ